MKILWVCNIMLPLIAGHLGMEISNKEGWLSGLCERILKEGENSPVSLSVCFPVSRELDGTKGTVRGLSYYGFYEDTAHEELYEEALEVRLKRILDEVKPDVLHIFGTEFAHSLAAAKAFDRPGRTLVGIQGVCYECAKVYTQGLPEKIVKRRLFRDFIKKDNISRQQEKFRMRGEREIELFRRAGNVTGRTEFDRQAVERVNPESKYHFMNETLRSNFYTGYWRWERCTQHSLFMSQGNYPLKGLHYALEAIGRLVREYPDIMLNVSGDVITAYSTVKDKLKIGSYGKYILELIHKYGLEHNVHFTGRLDAGEMKECYLGAHILLSPSVLENSPNSVGEAMLLGMPVISSDVGGVRSLAEEGEILFYENGNVEQLCSRIREIFKDRRLAESLSHRSRQRASETHSPEKNFERLMEIYDEVSHL